MHWFYSYVCISHIHCIGKNQNVLRIHFQKLHIQYTIYTYKFMYVDLAWFGFPTDITEMNGLPTGALHFLSSIRHFYYRPPALWPLRWLPVSVPSKGHVHHSAWLVRWLIQHQFQDAEDHQGQVKDVPHGGSRWCCASKPTALAKKGKNQAEKRGPRRAEAQKEWSMDSYLGGRKGIEIMNFR